MNLFGGAAKFVDFTNSKGESFQVFDKGTIWGENENKAKVRFNRPFAINIANNIVGGTVTSNLNNATAGTEITLSNVPSIGYELVCYKINENIINDKFIMPEEDVTINAIFNAINYSINIGQIVNGTVTANVQSATMGTEVTLSNIPSNGYNFINYVVTDSNGNNISVVNGKFIMPVSSVNISASFERDPYSTPLTLEAMEAGAVVKFENESGKSVTYRVNGGTPQIIEDEDYENITLANVGDKVEFYGDVSSYTTGSRDDPEESHILCSKDCYVYGNIMSLIKSVGFENETTLTGKYTFRELFSGNTHIKNKTGYELLLPATTLAWRSYYRMFKGCTGLTSTPILPATTLTEQCYFFMFSGCTNLNKVTCLATDISASSCTMNWLEGVATNGTFTKAANMSSWTTGANGIPSGWTVQDYQG